MAKKKVKKKVKKKAKKKAKKKKAVKKKTAEMAPRKKTKHIAPEQRLDTPVRHALLTELAVSMVRERMSEGHTLASVAKALRISRWYLSRIFAEQRKETFSRFATRERLKVARRLLGNMTLKIFEVAFACGFRNPDHFSAWFRRHQRRSPTAYRARVLRK